MKNLQLLWVSDSTLQPGHSVKTHAHDDYYHLVCVKRGVMQFTLDRDTFPLHEGDAVLVHKGVQHGFVNITGESILSCEIKFVVLNKALDRILSRASEGPFCDSFVSQLISHIAREYSQNKAMKDDAAAVALETLIYHLTSDMREGDSSRIIDTSGYSDLSRRVIDYLTEHYDENISLDDVSQGVAITKTYLCNAFRKNTGMTIFDCLKLIRIRKAAEFLVYSDLSLNQIAQMCGLVSASHFNRVFMHYVGIPPGQCRRAYAYNLLAGAGDTQRGADSFMYSVLAGKAISPEIINSFESLNHT